MCYDLPVLENLHKSVILIESKTQICKDHVQQNLAHAFKPKVLT